MSQSTPSEQLPEVGSRAPKEELFPRGNRTVRSNIVFTFVLALSLLLAWHIRNVILLVYVSALFAVVLMPIVGWMMRLKFGRWRLGKWRQSLRCCFWHWCGDIVRCVCLAPGSRGPAGLYEGTPHPNPDRDLSAPNTCLS